MDTPRALEAERANLIEFLDDQREALITRLDGLNEGQARATPTASSLSLLGIVRHSAIWERRWFQVLFAGRRFAGEWPDEPDEDPGQTFRLADDDTVAGVIADYRTQIAASNAILRTEDLNARCDSDKVDEPLRWVAVHMIEETARHAGHADIIRETIDGARGG